MQSNFWTGAKNWIGTCKRHMKLFILHNYKHHWMTATSSRRIANFLRIKRLLKVSLPNPHNFNVEKLLERKGALLVNQARFMNDRE